MLRRHARASLAGLVLFVSLVSCTNHPAPTPTRVPAPSIQPQVLTAAPRECPIGIGPLRGNHLPLEQTPKALRGHLPAWLPDGFGVAVTVNYGRGGASATWVNEACNEVTVGFNPQRQQPTPGPHVGAWTVTVDAPGCSNYVLGPGTCLGYTANSSDGSVWIQAMGIERSVGDRIVQSIPLD
jgi:hypothetical protein